MKPLVAEFSTKGKGTINVQKQMQKQEITEGTITAPKIHIQQFD